MDFIPFINYCNKHITGDQKGQAQIFLDHFFTTLGYEDGLRGAVANCEYWVKEEKKKTTSFAAKYNCHNSYIQHVNAF